MSRAASETGSHLQGSYSAIEGADALLICTEWQVFGLRFDRMKRALNTPHLRPQPV